MKKGNILIVLISLTLLSGTAQTINDDFALLKTEMIRSSGDTFIRKLTTINVIPAADTHCIISFEKEDYYFEKIEPGIEALYSLNRFIFKKEKPDTFRIFSRIIFGKEFIREEHPSIVFPVKSFSTDHLFVERCINHSCKYCKQKPGALPHYIVWFQHPVNNQYF